jgi:glycosyltransferase involved in cell wall biosynthesis
MPAADQISSNGRFERPSLTMSVAVIIPTYNGAPFLREAVESVWQQTSAAKEVLVIDDCSTDGTPDIARRLAARSPVPMTVVCLPNNSGGPARPINVGIRAASGEFVVILDQDDVLDPNRIEAHLALLGADTKLALVVSGGRNWSGDRRFPSGAGVEELTAAGTAVAGCVRIDGPELLRLLLLHYNLFMGYPAFTFRRATVLRKGGVDTGLRIASDYDLLCWLCLQGNAAFIPQAHYRRRMHGDNLTNDRFRTIFELLKVRSRYVRHCKSAMTPGADRTALRHEYLAFAYAMRRAGRFGAAIAVTSMALRIWGLTPSVISELTKVIPHMVLSKLTGRYRDTPYWEMPQAPRSTPPAGAPAMSGVIPRDYLRP